MDKGDNQPLDKVPLPFNAARSELPDEVVIIARWDDDQSHLITIQDFSDKDGPFIPVFSDGAGFHVQTSGSGFEDQGVVVKTDFLLSILHGGERLVLDPGSASPHSIKLPRL
jgi:hypothetical protein